MVRVALPNHGICSFSDITLRGRMSTMRMKQRTAKHMKGHGGRIARKTAAVVALGSMTMLGAPAPAAHASLLGTVTGTLTGVTGTVTGTVNGLVGVLTAGWDD